MSLDEIVSDKTRLLAWLSISTIVDNKIEMPVQLPLGDRFVLDKIVFEVPQNNSRVWQIQ